MFQVNRVADQMEYAARHSRQGLAAHRGRDECELAIRHGDEIMTMDQTHWFHSACEHTDLGQRNIGITMELWFLIVRDQIKVFHDLDSTSCQTSVHIIHKILDYKRAYT